MADIAEAQPAGLSSAALQTPADRYAPNSRYAWYVLFVLTIVYAVNAMDRAILSILAQDIKEDFGLSDAQLGFLHGTAFGVFYALFGYPMGRLVDRWRRTYTLSIGLTIWSSMTVVCGLSSNIWQLAPARVGVAVGEAAASPVGFSLVTDWFTKDRRGLALGIFIGGLFCGSGLAFALGGAIAQYWDTSFAGDAPLGLSGWQGTFVVLGLPGLLLAIWVATLHEPRRGLSDGVVRPEATEIWRPFLTDLMCVIPPFTLLQAARISMRVFVVNLGVAALATALALVMIYLLGDVMQWAVLCTGFYAAFSAAQSMKHRDYPTFALTWRTPTFRYAALGFGGASLMNVIAIFWIAPLSLRVLPIDKATSGLILGSITAVAGMLGVMTGGKMADILLRYSPAGRVWVGIFATLGPVPFLITICNTSSPWIFYLAYVPIAYIGTSWLAAGAATVQELVLPRMRGTATITYFLASTMLASGLGPYTIGKISGYVNDLATGILWGLSVVPFAVMALIACARTVESAEATKWERAHAAGEPE